MRRFALLAALWPWALPVRAAPGAAPPVVLRELLGSPPSPADLLGPDGADRLAPLGPGAAFAAGPDLEVAATGGWHRRNREVDLRFEVCDPSPTWPRGRSARALDRSDRVELRLCDFGSTSFSRWAFSPGNFKRIRPFAVRLEPVADEWPDEAEVFSRSHAGGFVLVVRFADRPFVLPHAVPRPLALALTSVKVRDRGRPERDVLLAAPAGLRDHVWQTYGRVAWAVCRHGGVLARTRDRRFEVRELPQEADGEPGAVPAELVEAATGRRWTLGFVGGCGFSPDGRYLAYDYLAGPYRRDCAVLDLGAALAREDAGAGALVRAAADPGAPAWLRRPAGTLDTFVRGAWVGDPRSPGAEPHTLDLRLEVFDWSGGGPARRYAETWRHEAGTRSFARADTLLAGQ